MRHCMRFSLGLMMLLHLAVSLPFSSNPSCDINHPIEDGPANLPVAAQTIIDQITFLSQPPTNARSFLVVDISGQGKVSPTADAFRQQYFSGLASLHASIADFRVAFVNFLPLWSGVLGATPGYEAFGYTSSGACTVNSSTIVDSCSDPEHTFFWIPG
jgi:hypothetical protein